MHGLSDSPHEARRAWQITLSGWRWKMHSTTWENASQWVVWVVSCWSDMARWGWVIVRNFELSQDQVICPPLITVSASSLVSCRWWWQFWFWFWFYTPLLKEITETVVPDSCSQVSMEMTVMGEYVCVEGRYGKAFIKESELVCRTPIHVFPMDEDCMGLLITIQVSVMFWALV